VEGDFLDLGQRTEGFSGSDIAVVVKDVLMQPIRLLKEATHFRKVSAADTDTDTDTDTDYRTR
jgi:vacuolar protein-sorting-associated protein 4